RWLVGPAFGLLGASVVDTGSRGGLVALGLGLVVFAIGRARSTWVRVRNAAVTALAIGVLVYATYANSLMRARFAEALTRGALAGRERIYPALMHMAAERPLVGWGPVNNKYGLGSATYAPPARPAPAAAGPPARRPNRRRLSTLAPTAADGWHADRPQAGANL